MRIVNLEKFVAVVGLLVELTGASVHGQSEWKKRWEQTIDAGKKEGEVAIYGPHNPAYQQVWSLFQKSYPEIKFNFVPGKGSEHAQRIVAERRAGKYLADLLMGGSSTYASFAPNKLKMLRELFKEVPDYPVTSAAFLRRTAAISR